MKEIPSEKFKARCLRLLDEVHSTREPVLITKRGRPMAKLVPVEDEPREFLGRLKGIVKIVGDIESPVASPDEWREVQ